MSVLKLKTTPAYSEKNIDYATIIVTALSLLRDQSQKAPAINLDRSGNQLEKCKVTRCGT